jgi:metallophosphoesterase (TIGR03768 family)
VAVLGLELFPFGPSGRKALASGAVSFPMSQDGQTTLVFHCPYRGVVVMEILRRDFLKYFAGATVVLGLELSPLGMLKKLFAAGGVPSQPTYQIGPITSTLERVIFPQPVPSPDPNPYYSIYPCELSEYEENGFGLYTWKPPINGAGVYVLPNMSDGKTLNTRIPDSSSPLLLNFFTLSDTHLSDKESPARNMGFGYRYPNPLVQNEYPMGGISYSGIVLSTTQRFDAAVQTINAQHQLTPFNFGIHLGDAADNTQYNELRWHIDILDGKMITPSSGAHLGAGTIDYQKPFQAAGLDRSIPWYQAIGNHDQFWMGVTQVTDMLRNVHVGSQILTIGVAQTVEQLEMLQVADKTPQFWQEVFNAPFDQRWYMGVVNGKDPYGAMKGAGPTATTSAVTVAADRNRRALSIHQWMNEFFNTESHPVGHGFTRQMASEGFACYSFHPVPGMPIKVIVFDDTDKRYHSSQGSVDQKRFQWLKTQLAAGQKADELMIVCAHVPLKMYAQIAMGDDPGSDPSYITSRWQCSDVPVDEIVTACLNNSNLVLWAAGHEHRNTVTPQPASEGSNRGFWVAETASTRDFPHQFRSFRIIYNSSDPSIGGEPSISILALDHDLAVKDNTPAGDSRAYAIGAAEIFQASLLPHNDYNNYQQGPGMDPNTGVYNAELVIPLAQLSPGLQSKLQKLGPIVGFFKINGGTNAVTSPTITLNSSVLGSIPTYYRASESPKFKGADWHLYPDPGAPLPTFTLSRPSGSGAKVVYFQVRDGNGRVSPVVHDCVHFSKATTLKD